MRILVVDDHPIGNILARSGRACLALCVLVCAASCKPADQPVAMPISPQLLSSWFATLQSNETAQDIQGLLAQSSNASPADPNWPVFIYLVGESHLMREDVDRARTAFRDLAMWAVSDQGAGPYKDGWGGSGLAVIGLWRWLQILNIQGGTAVEVQQALSVAAALQKTRLFTGMVRGDLLPALPLLEEDVARLLAHVAAAAQLPQALPLYLDYMSINSSGELDATDQRLRARLLDEQLATIHRLDLFQLRRQISRIKVEERKQAAAEKLRLLWENQQAPPDVRAEAGYEWSNYHRLKEGKKKDVVAALGSVFELAGGKGSIAERALYLRGTVQNAVAPRQPEAFFADMQRLLTLFPNGRMADDALYQVATEHLLGAQPDLDRAFSDFEKLRAFAGTNDWLDSAYVLPALGRIDRGTESDLKEADRLFTSYLKRFPDGVFRLRSLFWRGRVAELRGDTKTARGLYQQVITEAPYDYYGLRAGMHLDHGAKAISMALPQAQSNTWGRIRVAYRNSVPDVELSGTTPYHDRLRTAERIGLYSQLRTIVDDLGRRFRNRLDNVPLKELDEHKLIPAAALLLAMRQDAVAARDLSPTADNQLRLAGLMGKKLGDWPTALNMGFVPADAPSARIGAMQNDPRFLATLYPGFSDLNILKEPLTKSAWQISGSTVLSEALMYAIMRRESAYYPGAISPVGALGLFQIMPATFDETKDCWKAREDEKPTAPSYLFDPNRNTQFWSCWVRKEFEPRTVDDVPLMLVNHMAGAGNLAVWRTNWKGRTIERDLELQIEVLRFPATRVFVRRVLADMAIVDAAGLF